LLEETWDRSTNMLHGVSRVVANDPYELRIVAMGEDGPWRVTGLTVRPRTDSNVGAAIRVIRQDDWRVRVCIDAPENLEVCWSIRFAPAR